MKIALKSSSYCVQNFLNFWMFQYVLIANQKAVNTRVLPLKAARARTCWICKCVTNDQSKTEEKHDKILLFSDVRTQASSCVEPPKHFENSTIKLHFLNCCYRYPNHLNFTVGLWSLRDSLFHSKLFENFTLNDLATYRFLNK